MIQLADSCRCLQSKFIAKLADENEEVITASLVVMQLAYAVVSRSKGYSANANATAAVVAIIDDGGAFVIVIVFFIVNGDDARVIVAATRALAVFDETAIVDNRLWDDTHHLGKEKRKKQRQIH